jgi:hypothetical protein
VVWSPVSGRGNLHMLISDTALNSYLVEPPVKESDCVIWLLSEGVDTALEIRTVKSVEHFASDIFTVEFHEVEGGILVPRHMLETIKISSILH